MPTAAIRDVELITTGTWAASTGQTAVTAEQLAAMLAAGTDGLLDAAPIKLGHVSPLNAELGDGEPAYGWVKPTRVGPSTSQPGETSLYGDLVGIPKKLAEAIPTAYRRRSVEVAYEVKARSGKLYSAVLTAVALLGITKPAVKGLADIVALYSAQGVTAGRVDALGVTPAAAAMLAAADQAGASPELIAALEAAAGVRDTADVPPPVDETVNDPTRETDTRPGGQTMPGVVSETRIRELLAAEADADVEATLAALRTPGTPAPTAPPIAAPPAATAPAPVATPPAHAAPTATDAPTTTPAPAAPAPLPIPTVAAAAAPGTVMLSEGQWAQVQVDTEWARTERRRQVLDNAVIGGRIAPSERGKLTSEHKPGEVLAVTGFAAALERDEPGTTALLGQLAPRFPVTAAGAANAPHAELSEGPDDAAWAAFDLATFGIEPAPAQ